MIMSIDADKLKEAREYLADRVYSIRHVTHSDEAADAIALLLLATTPPRHDNEGLPCEFCGEKLKTLQIDRSLDGKRLQVRINWSWTKKEVGKQLKGLASLIKSMAEGLDE